MRRRRRTEPNPSSDLILAGVVVVGGIILYTQLKGGGGGGIAQWLKLPTLLNLSQPGGAAHGWSSWLNPLAEARPFGKQLYVVGIGMSPDIPVPASHSEQMTQMLEDNPNIYTVMLAWQQQQAKDGNNPLDWQRFRGYTYTIGAPSPGWSAPPEFMAYS